MRFSLSRVNMFLVILSIVMLLPQIVQAEQSESAKADIVFVIDISGSMDDRINNVKSVATSVAQDLDLENIDCRFGGVTYLAGIERTRSLTSNATVFQEWMDSLSTGGGTDLN